MDQIKIGKFIADLRKEQNMTQLDLATKLGITDRAVSKWENGRGMPDLSLLKPLCEILSISINELLNGERITIDETPEITDKNMIGMLSEREREIKKRRNITIITILLGVLTAILLTTHSIMFSVQLIATLRGDGFSFDAAHYTHKAEKTAKYISDGNYEKASKLISFPEGDRHKAETEWCSAMKTMSETLIIEHFSTSRMIEEDEFISGKAILIVCEWKSGKKFVFDVNFALQNGGLAFAVSTTGIDEGELKSQIAKQINDALSTWYAG